MSLNEHLKIDVILGLKKKSGGFFKGAEGHLEAPGHGGDHLSGLTFWFMDVFVPLICLYFDLLVGF